MPRCRRPPRVVGRCAPARHLPIADGCGRGGTYLGPGGRSRRPVVPVRTTNPATSSQRSACRSRRAAPPPRSGCRSRPLPAADLEPSPSPPDVLYVQALRGGSSVAKRRLGVDDAGAASRSALRATRDRLRRCITHGVREGLRYDHEPYRRPVGTRGSSRVVGGRSRSRPVSISSTVWGRARRRYGRHRPSARVRWSPAGSGKGTRRIYLRPVLHRQVRRSTRPTRTSGSTGSRAQLHLPAPRPPPSSGAEHRRTPVHHLTEERRDRLHPSVSV